MDENVKKLIVVCYPLDWHWVLSTEYISSHIDVEQFEILDLSQLGENGVKNFFKKFFNGNIFQRKIQKNLACHGIKIMKYRSYFHFQYKLGYLFVNFEKWTEEDFGPTYNSIVEFTGSLRIHHKKHKEIIWKELVKDILVKKILSELNLEKYDEIVTVNGRFTKNATVVQWCKENQMLYKLLEFGSSKEKFEIYLSSPHSMQEIELKISQHWENFKSHSKKSIAETYLNKLCQDSDFAKIGWRNRMKTGEAPTISNKLICTFYASTEVEYAGVGDIKPEGFFKNQVEAFEALLKCLDSSTWHIYLRRHPKNPSAKIADPEQFLWSKFSNSNLTIISPESSIDSLALGKQSDLIANYSSLIAMEFIARGFENVITMGPAPWNKLLPTRYTPSIEALKRYLNQSSPKINSEDIYPWAYYYATFGTEFKVFKYSTPESRWVFR